MDSLQQARARRDRILKRLTLRLEKHVKLLYAHAAEVSKLVIALRTLSDAKATMMTDCSAEESAVQAAQEAVTNIGIALATSWTLTASLQFDLATANAYLDAAEDALYACQNP